MDRGHYAFVEREGRIVGFIGWAFVAQPLAEARLRAWGDVTDAEARSGDCVLLNAWTAEGEGVSRFILRALPGLFAVKHGLYARRFYADGRARPLRLDIARRAGAG